MGFAQKLECVEDCGASAVDFGFTERRERSDRSGASPAAAGENPTEAHQRRADEPTEDGPSSWRRVRAHVGGPELMKEGPELWSGLETRSGTDRRSLICFASNELGPVI